MDNAPQNPVHCTRCGHPHARDGRPTCTAHTRAGGSCRNWPLPGVTVCRMHGGSTPRARSAAARRVAERQAQDAVVLFGARRDIHPADALLELVQWTAGEVEFWREQVRQLAERNPEALTWGVTKVKEGGDDSGTTSEARPNVAYVMLTDASKRLEAHSVAALRAGVEERRVQIAASQGNQVVAVLQRILDALFRSLVAAGLSETVLREAWVVAVAEIVPREMRSLGEP